MSREGDLFGEERRICQDQKHIHNVFPMQTGFTSFGDKDRNNMRGTLLDKVALVTGAGSGIGRAAAIAFAREGCRVVVSDINPVTGTDTTKQIVTSGGSAKFIPADVVDVSQVKSLIKATVDLYGRLDCAHNNAGVEGDTTPFHEYPEKIWDRVISVNLKGVWLCMKFEIEQMLRQGEGAIVNTSSGAGLVGTSNGSCAYNASKHGIIGLTRTAALEYALRGIRVNAVCPGAIKTPMAERLLGENPDMMAKTAGRIPVGRWGTPEEVAEVVVWLCSDAASFLTGHPLPVDGGFLAG